MRGAKQIKRRLIVLPQREGSDAASSVLSRDGEGPGVSRGQRQSGGEERPSLGVDVGQRLRVAAFDQSGTRLVEIGVTRGYLSECVEVLKREGLIPDLGTGFDQTQVAPRRDRVGLVQRLMTFGRTLIRPLSAKRMLFHDPKPLEVDRG